MNPPNDGPESPLNPEASIPVTAPRRRPFYWSVRRELWEHRYVYIAPLAVGAVVLVGFVINAIHLTRTGGVLALHIPNGPSPIEQPYAIAAVLVIFGGYLTGAFYSLEALHGERRDRSILFWKALPVSDMTTVLSKASIPLVVLPLLTLGVVVVTHVLMLLLNLLVLLTNGSGVTMLQARTPLFELWITLLYGLIALALWQVPIYGWVLLVSGWARRAALLWVSLPLIAIYILEKIAFRTSHSADFFGYRFWGWFAEAFGSARPCCVPHPLATLTLRRFLSAPGLWIGLAIAAIFLVGAARLRRCRGPI